MLIIPRIVDLDYSLSFKNFGFFFYFIRYRRKFIAQKQDPCFYEKSLNLSI